jgi:phage terminase small subunit
LKVYAFVELTPREEKFVLAIACYGYSATRAAVEAGYSISAPRILLAKPHIQAALHDISENAAACLEKFSRRQARRAERRAAA